MKVMNSSCFVTEQTKVHMEGDLGTTRAQLWHHWSLPQPPLALSVSETSESSQQLPPCWEFPFWHLPSVKKRIAFENSTLEKR